MMAVQDTTQSARPANRFERAKQLPALGYSISQSVYCRALWEVRKPDGTVYRIDAEDETCSCPAFVADCSHVLFVRKCQAYCRYLDALQADADSKGAAWANAYQRGVLEEEFDAEYVSAVWRLADVVGGRAWEEMRASRREVQVAAG